MPRALSLEILLLVLVALPGSGAAQQESTPARRDWTGEFRDLLAAGQDPTLFIRRAGHAGDESSRQLLLDLAETFPAGTYSWPALEELGRREDVDYPTRVLDLVRKTTKRADKRRLLELLERSHVHRVRALESLVELVRRHRGDLLGLDALAVVERYVERPPSTEHLEQLARLLHDLYLDDTDRQLADPAWGIAMRLPERMQLPFLVSALERLDPRRAAQAGRLLLARRVDGAEDLIVEFFASAGEDAIRAGLTALFDGGGRLLLWVRLLERVDELEWRSLGRIRYLLRARGSRSLEAYLLAALGRDDRPKLSVLAMHYVRDHRLESAVDRIREQLLVATEPHRRIMAAEVLSELTGKEESWRQVHRYILSGSLDEKVDRLEALTHLALDSDRVRGWMRTTIRTFRYEWPVLAQLLRAAGSVGFSDIGDLCEPYLAHRRWPIRLAAVDALVLAGTRRVLPRLAVMTGDERYRIARAAADGLYRLTGERFGLDPDGWRRHIAKLAADWQPLRLPPPTGGSAGRDPRYAPRFYELDLRSDRIVFVCDVSGSMQGSKLVTLKDQLGAAIDGVPAHGGFNVIFFSDRITPLWSRLVKGVPKLKKRSRAKIAQVVAGGGTNLYDGLRLAMGDDEADTIVVLTDGHPSAGKVQVPESILEQIRRANRYRGLQVHTIYVEDPESAGGRFGLMNSPISAVAARDFLKRLAEENGGVFKIARIR